MHAKCMQTGHFGRLFEFIPRDAFIDAIKGEKKEPDGSFFIYDIPMVDITGDIAIAKVSYTFFGTRCTDYMKLVKHEGKWQIVMKAFYDHANYRS